MQAAPVRVADQVNLVDRAKREPQGRQPGQVGRPETTVATRLAK